MYDFTTVYSRAGTGSEKWNLALKSGMAPGIVPLTVADMEFSVAPEIIEAVQAVAQGGLWGYTFADDDFRQAACDWLSARHGWTPKPQWAVNTFGIVPALYVAVRAFTRPGDAVLVQPPVYPPFFSAAKAAGRAVVENPLTLGDDGQYHIDFDHLEACAARPEVTLMLFCNPHNPGGRVWTGPEVERVARICRENGVTLFSDEIHGDLLMPGYRLHSVGAVPPDCLENCLIATSTTKSFNTAGLPCSTIFAPGQKARAAFEAQMDTDGYEFNSIMGIAAAKAAYQKGGPWLDELLGVIEGNHRALTEAFAAQMPKMVVLPLQATYLAWIDCRAMGLAPAELTRFLREKAQLYVNPGESFGTGGEGFVRLNMACARTTLKAAVQRLAAAYVSAGY